MKFRVAEIFGPTVQGEGRRAGIPCHFVRFGGCDFRCHWCDTPHAVLPEQVAQLPRMDEEQIVDRVKLLDGKPKWVVLTGGNPALLDLRYLVACLFEKGYSVMVETQGSIWRDWLGNVDELCISPKPPSAGTMTNRRMLQRFLDHAVENMHGLATETCYLKVVVFDDADYEYAKAVHHAFPNFDMFLSVGTYDEYMPTVGNPYPDTSGFGSPIRSITRDVTGRNYRLLAEKVAADPDLRDVRVLPQLHVIAWGAERGH